MAPHEQRVIDEKTELDEKIERLAIFITASATFCELPAAERERLQCQIAVMVLYSEILGRRIAAFPPS